MFGSEKTDTEPREIAPELPPLATITVVVGYSKVGTIKGELVRVPIIEVWEGHQIENTTIGGLNIHRYYPVGAERVLQKLVVGYAPGEWKKITQSLDVVEPSRIIH